MITTGKDLREREGGNAVVSSALRKKEYRSLIHLRDMFDSAVKREVRTPVILSIWRSHDMRGTVAA